MDASLVHIRKVDSKYKHDTQYAFTNNRGRFEVKGLPSGIYSVKFEEAGHKDQRVPEQRLLPGNVLHVSACLEGSTEIRPTWDQFCSQNSEQSGQIVVDREGRYEGSKFLLRGIAFSSWDRVPKTMIVIMPLGQGQVQVPPEEEISLEVGEDGEFEVELDPGQVYQVFAFLGGFYPAQLFRLRAKSGHTADLRVCMKRSFDEVTEL